jgi:hypothetical protein
MDVSTTAWMQEVEPRRSSCRGAVALLPVLTSQLDVLEMPEYPDNLNPCLF